MQYSYRPTGISIVAIVWGFVGVALVLIGLGCIAAFAALGSSIGLVSNEAGGAVFLVGLLLGLFFIALGGLGFATSVGLWRMRAWAWWSGVILAGLAAFMWFALALLSLPAVFVSFVCLFFAAVPIATLVYLFMDEAREACRIDGANRGAPRPAPRPRATARHADLCPNPRCGRAVQPRWRFCPACRTNLDFTVGRPMVARR